MDFCLDGMLGVGLNNNGSGNAKQSLCRSASEMDLEQTSRDQDWRTSSSIKMPRTDSTYPTLLRSSSVISEANNTGGVKNNSDFLDESRLSSPYSRALYQQHTTAAYPHQYASNGATRPPSSVLMGAGMHAILRSPFTPAQWQELELQALIFKYMVANVHVPPELLIPLRTKSGIFSALPAPGSSLRSNMGWGSFHLGFTNNADPEPGRCRRTDGKKWRCSRDAVPDQKYCERHMNRGRHRSRKPVEGQTATQQHAATSNSVSLSRNNTSVSVTTSSSPSNPPHHQIGKLSSPPTQFHMPLDRYARGLKGDMETTNISEPSMMNPNSNTTAWRSRVTSSPSDMVHYGAQDFVNMNILRDQNPRGGGGGGSENSQGSSQGVIRHFFDDWPRSRSRDGGAGAAGAQWSGTHLSMSMDSCSDKLTLSPLKLSMSARDDPLGMELGLANDADDEHNRQRQTTNWIPITWESPVGGPLAEVLNSSKNKNLNLKSSLNLMPDAWECSGSPGRGDYSRMASPTGVLQKAFGSLSDNSTSSSPRSMLPKLEQAPLCVAAPFNVSGVISTT